MSRNGSGTYQAIVNSWNPATTGVPATAADWQALLNDIVAALTQSVSKDGQTAITGNLPMGGNKLTSLSAGTTTGDSLRFEQLFSQGQPTDIASATTCDIGAVTSTILNVTGTTTITSFGVNYNGPRFVRFAGALTLTHNATTLILPGAANITTAAGDSAILVPVGSPASGWRVAAYDKADGSALSANLIAATTAGTSTAYTITPSPAISAYAANQSFWVTFHVASGAAPTLTISGVATPPQLVKQDVTGAYVNIQSGDIPINHRSRVTLISTTQALVEELPPSVNQIQPVTASVAGNALTVGLNPTVLEFRSTTLTTGVPNKRTVPTAISLVVPNTATLGTISAVASRLILVAIDNAGTVELAIINIAGGTNLDETGLISTTAISGAATSASVFYSTTARTNVPYRVVGCVDSTQTTAGTWASAPTLVQGMGGNALAAMQSLGYGQTWQNVAGSRVSGTTYYNTTGKPIMVSASFNGNSPSTGGSMSATVNGISVGSVSHSVGGSVGTNTTLGFSFIVPTGGSYVVTGSTTLTSWSELR